MSNVNELLITLFQMSILQLQEIIHVASFIVKSWWPSPLLFIIEINTVCKETRWIQERMQRVWSPVCLKPTTGQVEWTRILALHRL